MHIVVRFILSSNLKFVAESNPWAIVIRPYKGGYICSNSLDICFYPIS